MKDSSCVSFLRWALPRMGMEWKGFRKVRRQVCRRISGRMRELGLTGVEEYRSYLATDPEEWEYLAVLCRVTISRFNRDRGTFQLLEEELLPLLAREAEEVWVWAAGCASGEEPYTVSLIWDLKLAHRFPRVSLRILATDVDAVVLERARTATYSRGSLRDLQPDRVDRAFTEEEGELRLRNRFRRRVEFRLADIRRELPDGPFHLILCRNLVFTYFDEGERRRLLSGLLGRLEPRGFLILGSHERLPEGEWPLHRWSEAESVFRKE